MPKCYLRNFAADEGLCSINLFNLKTGKVVERASIKSQCAKNYLYGKDPTLEQSFQGIEGKFADCMRQVVSGLPIDQDTLNFLKDFSLFQFLRTDVAFRRQAIAMSKMADLIFENSPEQRPNEDFDHAFAAMDSFLRGRHIVADLRVILIINKTNTPFITSDDPAVTFNKFYVQKVPWKPASGLNNSGCCIFLTLTSNIAVLAYDSDVYSIFSPGNLFVLEKKSDADSFNELITIKSNENIYFQDAITAQYVKDLYEAVKDKRPNSWHRVHYAILDGNGIASNRLCHLRAPSAPHQRADRPEQPPPFSP